MTEREEQAITVLNTLYNNPLLSDIHRQALEVGIMAIKAASSPEKPNKWIPVSERLPEENDVYLVAVNSWGCPTRDVDGFMAHTDRKWEVYGNKVVAWMPLPEPYLPDINVGNMSEIPTGAEGSDKE